MDSTDASFFMMLVNISGSEVMFLYYLIKWMTLYYVCLVLEAYLFLFENI